MKKFHITAKPSKNGIKVKVTVGPKTVKKTVK